MKSEKIRKTFLEFFQKQHHKIFPSSPLLDKADASVLFTTAGMQQFKPYYGGQKDPEKFLGTRKAASCQKCFRTSDIEQVGDESHLTFLEMLGNFSFGDPKAPDGIGQKAYYKKEAIEWALQFLIEICRLKIDNLWITYFKGNSEVPEDKEAKEIWQRLGITQRRIYGFGRKDNFWGPTGEQGPCGPTSEIHIELRSRPCSRGKNCLPNCSCGRFVEVWNLVFNEYYCQSGGELVPLSAKGIDTGLGLERLAMVLQKKDSLYGIDLFLPLIELIRKNNYPLNQKTIRAERILADHLRASLFLMSEGVRPANVQEGYVLRRILRRAFRFGEILDLPEKIFGLILKKVTQLYCPVYPELTSATKDAINELYSEKEKFASTLKRGLQRFQKIVQQKRPDKKISGQEAFYLYESFGFPLEMIQEMASEAGLEVDEKGFNKAFKAHQEVSRAGAQKKAGGLGRAPGYEKIKLHTATHLLHQALREILGPSVSQRGSDITQERLRFDFNYPHKISAETLKKIEVLVNQKIKENLPVYKKKLPLRQALEEGAIASQAFQGYPKIVWVYDIGRFSKEVCGGPHVQKTSELGQFKIIKEESIGRGLRRIKAILR